MPQPMATALKSPSASSRITGMKFELPDGAKVGSIIDGGWDIQKTFERTGDAYNPGYNSYKITGIGGWHNF